MHMEHEFISRLMNEIDDIKARIDAQTIVLENSPEKRLRGEQANGNRSYVCSPATTSEIYMPRDIVVPSRHPI